MMKIIIIGYNNKVMVPVMDLSFGRGGGWRKGKKKNEEKVRRKKRVAIEMGKNTVPLSLPASSKIGFCS